jgi:tRNA threonylcarbamoyl adenosine modification protein YeaZ
MAVTNNSTRPSTSLLPCGHWLAVDLSSPSASLSVHIVSPKAPRHKTVLQRELPQGYRHSEKWVEHLNELMTECQLDLCCDIAGFIAPVGPGSFTGLRVGLATLKAFCLALSRPLVLVDAHEARAASWRAAAHSRQSEVQYPLGVVTYSTSASAVWSRIGVGAESHLFQKNVPLPLPQEPELRCVLHDGRVAKPSWVEDADWVLWPATSERLATAVLEGTPPESMQILGTPQDVSRAAPAYFGSERFD